MDESIIIKAYIGFIYQKIGQYHKDSINDALQFMLEWSAVNNKVYYLYYYGGLIAQYKTVINEEGRLENETCLNRI